MPKAEKEPSTSQEKVAMTSMASNPIPAANSVDPPPSNPITATKATASESFISTANPPTPAIPKPIVAAKPIIPAAKPTHPNSNPIPRSLDDILSLHHASYNSSTVNPSKDITLPPAGINSSTNIGLGLGIAALSRLPSVSQNVESTTRSTSLTDSDNPVNTLAGGIGYNTSILSASMTTQRRPRVAWGQGLQRAISSESTSGVSVQSNVSRASSMNTDDQSIVSDKQLNDDDGKDLGLSDSKHDRPMTLAEAK